MNKIKKGDKVIVICGRDRNKIGVVETVYPRINRAVVSGVNIVKKHLKKSSKHPQGGIMEVSAPIHLSNLMLLDPRDNKPSRVGFSVEGKNKTRVSKLSGETIK